MTARSATVVPRRAGYVAPGASSSQNTPCRDGASAASTAAGAGARRSYAVGLPDMHVAGLERLVEDREPFARLVVAHGARRHDMDPVGVGEGQQPGALARGHDVVERAGR